MHCFILYYFNHMNAEDFPKIKQAPYFSSDEKLPYPQMVPEQSEKEALTPARKCQLILQSLKIKRLRKYKNFFRIDAAESLQQAYKSMNVFNSKNNLSEEMNNECQKAIVDIQKKMKYAFEQRSSIPESPKPNFDEEAHLKSFTDSLKPEEKKLAWYVPLRNECPRLASIILSDGLLKEMGYDPSSEEEMLQIQKFKLFAFDLINEETYSLGFAHYILNLHAYFYQYVLGEQTCSEIKAARQIHSINEFRGRQYVKAKIKVSMASPFIITYEIEDVLLKCQMDNKQILQERARLIEEGRKKAEEITKNYDIKGKSPIVCSYIKVEKRGKRIKKNDADEEYYQPIGKTVNKIKRKKKVDEAWEE